MSRALLALQFMRTKSTHSPLKCTVFIDTEEFSLVVVRVIFGVAVIVRIDPVNSSRWLDFELVCQHEAAQCAFFLKAPFG
jgi:hypothetical protein